MLSWLIAQHCKSIPHNLQQHVQQALQRPINLMAMGVVCHATKVIITHYCWASLSCSSVCAVEQNSFHRKAQSCHVAPTLAKHWLALWIPSPWQRTTFSISPFPAPSVHLEQPSPLSSSKIILPTPRANIAECNITRVKMAQWQCEASWSQKVVSSSSATTNIGQSRDRHVTVLV